MKKRPVNLDLTTLKFPVMAIVSILHRVSGVILFLLIPLLLFLLSGSLKSYENFEQVSGWLSTFPSKLIIFGTLTALIYHFFAGCRHLLMDVGFGEGLDCARKSAVLVMVLTVISMIGVGVWLW